MGRHDDAIADFSRAIELEPCAASSFNSRALAHDRVGAAAAALRDFSQAIALEPHNPVFRHNRCEGGEGGGGEGWTLGHPGTPIHPTDRCPTHTHALRGFCYRNLGDYERAIQDYTAAIDLDPGSAAAAHSNRGYAWRKLGQYEAAIADYTRALELDPSNLKTLAHRAYSHAKAGQYALAVQDYTYIIEADPRNAHALHNRAISFDKMGRYEAAIADFSKGATALTDKPTTPTRAPPRHVHPRPPPRSLPTTTPSAHLHPPTHHPVLELDNTNANAYFCRGATHDSIGAHDKAIKDYTIALDLDRQSPLSRA